MQLFKSSLTRLGIFLLCIFPCASASAEITSPMQGLPVYNFENHIAGWFSISHTYKDKGYKIGVDPQVLFHGKPSAYFESVRPEQSDDFHVGISQAFKPNDFKGKRVEFSGYVKTKDLNGWAGLWMKANSDEDVLAFDNMQNRPIKQTSDWQKFSVVLDIPEESNKLTIGFLFSGAGKIWLNGLSLTPVSKEVLTTAQIWDAKKYSAFADELRKTPKNLNFEQVAQERGPRQLLNWAVSAIGRNPDDYRIYVDRNTKLNGYHSACIQSKIANPDSFGSFDQDISAQNYRGKRLKFSGFVKTNKVADWTGLWMRVDGANGVIAFDNMEDRRINGTTNWKEYSVVLDVPAHSKKIRLGFMQAGSGTSWLSNCALNVVNANVAVTGKPIDLNVVPFDAMPLKPDLEFKSK